MKNKSLLKLVIILLPFTFLAGCATPGDTGLVTGGLIGGVTGSALTNGNPVATVAGAVGGAIIGKDTAERNYCY